MHKWYEYQSRSCVLSWDIEGPKNFNQGVHAYDANDNDDDNANDRPIL